MNKAYYAAEFAAIPTQLVSPWGLVSAQYALLIDLLAIEGELLLSEGGTLNDTANPS